MHCIYPSYISKSSIFENIKFNRIVDRAGFRPNTDRIAEGAFFQSTNPELSLFGRGQVPFEPN